MTPTGTEQSPEQATPGALGGRTVGGVPAEGTPIPGHTDMVQPPPPQQTYPGPSSYSPMEVPPQPATPNPVAIPGVQGEAAMNRERITDLGVENQRIKRENRELRQEVNRLRRAAGEPEWEERDEERRD